MADYSDRAIAMRMLDAREKGPSLKRMVLANSKKYGLLLLLTTIYAALMSMARQTVLAPIMPAFVVGAFARDFGWFRVSRKIWPFNEKVLDWEKIAGYASSELRD